MSRLEALARFSTAAEQLNPATMTTEELLLVVDALETALARMAGPAFTLIPGGAA